MPGQWPDDESGPATPAGLPQKRQPRWGLRTLGFLGLALLAMVTAISLGGYYAPRAAAFEQRYACCLAWGAQWDYQKIWRDRFDRLAQADTPSLSVAAQHISWVLNASSQDDVLRRLAPFKLDGVVQKITCPFLMLHGEGDEQIPLQEAQKCFAAVGSKNKTMKIFTREEGGYHHCQIDNQSICSAYMWDWLEQILEPAR